MFIFSKCPRSLAAESHDVGWEKFNIWRHQQPPKSDWSVFPWDPFYLQSICIKSWISKYVHVKQYDTISHPCSNFNGGLIKPPLKLEHVWINTFHR